MTKILIKFLSIFTLLIFTLACDRPVCKNTNPIFEKYAPGTKEYNNELIQQLTKIDKSKLSYWMDAYHESNISKYILVNIQGDGLCARMLLVVKDSDKGIEGILMGKGMGYRGAELIGLKFEVKQDSSTTEFIFREIGGIID